MAGGYDEQIKPSSIRDDTHGLHRMLRDSLSRLRENVGGIQDGQAGAGNLAANEFARRQRRGHVMATRDHQRRACDTRQQIAMV
jgi:hypothetical protein